MYTTNAIESLNRQFRKYTKTKSVYPTDMALMKCLYLATKNITKKWTMQYRNWGPILSELSIILTFNRGNFSFTQISVHTLF